MGDSLIDIGQKEQRGDRIPVIVIYLRIMYVCCGVIDKVDNEGGRSKGDVKERVTIVNDFAVVGS